MSLPIPFDYPVMEANTADDLPTGEFWQYEPKWDGFRCLAFRDGDTIELRSKAGQPLGRYFPELVSALRSLRARRFVLDGEIAIQREGQLFFDDLLMRIHPAESRIRKLAAETPATYYCFDLLVDDHATLIAEKPLENRREALDGFARRFFEGAIQLSPATRDLALARRWLRTGGGPLDGVVAKRLDLPYQGGQRTGMVKVKHLRTADCVIGGFRYGEKNHLVGSLLLGLYNDDGLLDHVGFCSGIKAADKPELTHRLEELIEPPGFTGRAPGGPSRWSTERSTEWQPLKSDLVVEVQYDHFSGGRFRHGTRLMRWRPDKLPRQCTFDQVSKAASIQGVLVSSGR
ncbi:MAG TPA: ATP-dependent DNA ligase [Bryobacteraceae bacterium]|nr:ATP-dependent DNA ligase [Bryobacteraceae bacterium]